MYIPLPQFYQRPKLDVRQDLPLTLPPLRSNNAEYSESPRGRLPSLNEIMYKPAYLSRRLVSQLIFPEHSTHSHFPVTESPAPEMFAPTVEDNVEPVGFNRTQGIATLEAHGYDIQKALCDLITGD